jgi:hypothetical protein
MSELAWTIIVPCVPAEAAMVGAGACPSCDSDAFLEEQGTLMVNGAAEGRFVQCGRCSSRWIATNGGQAFRMPTEARG